MKFSKKLAMAAVAALALVGTAACSNGGSNSSSSSSEKIPSKITKKTTVVFWNAMPGVQGSTLKQLTNEFEKKNLRLTLSWKTKVLTMICKLRSTQLCNHQTTCQLLPKHIQAGFGMLHKTRCL